MDLPRDMVETMARDLTNKEARAASRLAGQLRNEAEALVKGSAWLARRAELMLANIRDGRHGAIVSDAYSAKAEAINLARAFEDLAISQSAAESAEAGR